MFGASAVVTGAVAAVLTSSLPAPVACLAAFWRLLRCKKSKFKIRMGLKRILAPKAIGWSMAGPVGDLEGSDGAPTDFDSS